MGMMFKFKSWVHKKISMVIGLAIIVGICFALYWFKDPILEVFGLVDQEFAN